VAIIIAAAVLPFHDPIRLIEDLNVLDIMSNGRVSCVCALGYRPEEYEQFGVEISQRGKIAEQKLRLLLELRRGEPVIYEGRRIHVTPSAVTPGGVPIMWGGGSLAAARRAGRFGIDFFAQRNLPGLREAYEAEARAHGHLPGTAVLPEQSTPSAVFISRDPDEAWEELGPYLLHDARMYGSWNPDESTVGITHAQSLQELRESRMYLILTPEQAIELVKGPNPVLTLVPLCGGLPAAIAWKYLEQAAEVSAA
jgi:alkanesulfonate monooxygenase SsuD/methylene tetrahydromethanopterin reductase-like flavin-dependent oxidoreductase (luciferase family)